MRIKDEAEQQKCITCELPLYERVRKLYLPGAITVGRMVIYKVGGQVGIWILGYLSMGAWVWGLIALYVL
jgi:hypothetical protein